MSLLLSLLPHHIFSWRKLTFRICSDRRELGDKRTLLSLKNYHSTYINSSEAFKTFESHFYKRGKYITVVAGGMFPLFYFRK